MITLCPECGTPAVQLSAEVQAELNEHGLILIHSDCYFQEQLPFPSTKYKPDFDFDDMVAGPLTIQVDVPINTNKLGSDCDE